MRTLTLLLLVFGIITTVNAADGIDLSYQHGDQTFTGKLFLPPDAQQPVAGVLVVHEWWGHNAYARQRASEIAAAGYAAFAMDMYGVDPVDTPAEAKELATPFYQDRNLMRGRAQAALDALGAHESVDAERLAAIGFCFGGTVALELARSGAPLDATVSFHGGLATPMPGSKGTINGTVLVCHGGADPMVPPSELAGFMDEMEQAQADYRVEVYGGAVHAFTNSGATERGIPGVAYDAGAEAQSMVSMLTLFSETLTK